MKKLISILLCAIFVLSATVLTVDSASNPYPYSQDVDGDGHVETPCTWFTRNEACNRLGAVMPAWGNAINWYQGAANSGYAVGTVARPNSIAVWSIDTHNFGHVAFVVSVNGDSMTIHEGGRTDLDTTSRGEINGQVVPSTVGTNWYGRTMIGFIYLDYTGIPEVSWSANSHQNVSTTDASAVLAATVTVTGVPITKFTTYGIEIWNAFGIIVAQTTSTVQVSPSSNVTGIRYDVEKDPGVTLRTGKPYTYQFMVVVSGTTFTSEVKSFTTGGHHVHYFGSYLGVADNHPHNNRYKCICGKILENINEPNIITNCADCMNSVLPATVVLRNMKERYSEDEPILFAWDTSDMNTDRFDLHIGELQGNEYVWIEKYESCLSGINHTPLPAGKYCATVMALNIKYGEVDGDGKFNPRDVAQLMKDIASEAFEQ